MFCILFRVRDTLREAGLDGQVDGFLKREGTRRLRSEMGQLAREYVELDDQAGVVSRAAPFTEASNTFGDLHGTDTDAEQER